MAIDEMTTELRRLLVACGDDWPLPWVYDEDDGTITDAGGTLQYEGQDWVTAGRLTVSAVNAIPQLLAAVEALGRLAIEIDAEAKLFRLSPEEANRALRASRTATGDPSATAASADAGEGREGGR